ncbi:MAG TPA: YceI family protein [Flavipsychrobacter sp.]|nr:YceI family protein [Flavipsychrobacter sp.]
MATFKLDPTHSEVTFKVKHMMITNVTGNFATFDASMQSESDDFTDAKISFEADVNSISTNNEQRDGHLKSDDFFAADKFPKIRFTSTEMKKVNDEEYQLSGNITVRDVTKPITFNVEYGGTQTDPYGNVKSGFTLAGKISRKEFGLNWNAVTEAGGVVVSDEVKLQAEIQMVKS